MLQRVNTASLRDSAKVRRILLHLCQGRRGRDNGLVPGLAHALHSRAPCVQVRHHRAGVFIRYGNLEVVDWLQQHGLSRLERLLETLTPGDLEGDVFRVDRVLFAVGDGNEHIDDGIPGDDTLRE